MTPDIPVFLERGNIEDFLDKFSACLEADRCGELADIVSELATVVNMSDGVIARAEAELEKGGSPEQYQPIIDKHTALVRFISESIYARFGTYIDRTPAGSINILFTDPHFADAVDATIPLYNRHIFNIWSSGEDPQPLIEKSTERYLKIGNRFEVQKLYYNRIAYELNTTVQLEPSEVLSHLEPLADRIAGVVLDLAVITEITRFATAANPERFIREQILIPSDFDNIQAQLLLDLALFKILVNPSADSPLRDLTAAITPLGHAEALLDNPEMPQDLQYLKRVAAIRSNTAYLSLIYTHYLLDLMAGSPDTVDVNEQIFTSYFRNFVDRFHNFTLVVDRDPARSAQDRPEDQQSLPAYFGAEIAHRYAYAAALLIKAQNVLTSPSERFLQAKDELLTHIQERFQVGREPHNVAAELFQRAALVDHTDEAEHKKYHQLLRRLGISLPPIEPS